MTAEEIGGARRPLQETHEEVVLHNGIRLLRGLVNLSYVHALAGVDNSRLNNVIEQHAEDLTNYYLSLVEKTKPIN